MKLGKCIKCGRDNITPRFDVMLNQLKFRCACGNVWFEATYESDIKSGVRLRDKKDITIPDGGSE